MNGFYQQNPILNALVIEQFLSLKQAERLFHEFNQQSKAIITFLVENKHFNGITIAQHLSSHFKIPYQHIETIQLDYLPDTVITVFKEKLMQKYFALPIAITDNKILIVALADPTQKTTLAEIQFNTGMTTKIQLTDHDTIRFHIDNTFKNTAKTNKEQYQINEPTLSNVTHEDNIHRYTDDILLLAVKQGASDIHFEPYETNFRIRFRIDGILTLACSLTTTYADKIAARLKVIASLNIAEHRLPQDGRFSLKISNNTPVHFRINTLPTLWGEKIVIRILPSTANLLAISKLGYSPKQEQHYLNALYKPQGMILITGPTGSGKTMSLYSGLQILNTENSNISTIEDPIEMSLYGINQVQVTPKIGITFSKTLRAFLRQDPDIIMVGEIRDQETAEIAIKASQTGHLVLSTLHTNSAKATLTRLLNMGVASYNLASAISLIISQRLIRILCQHCKVAQHLPSQELIKQGFCGYDLSSLTLYQAQGCQHCNNGFFGRTAIIEMIEISEKTAQLLMQEASSAQINDQLEQEGFCSLREIGLEKVAQGITSLQELNRVLGE